MAKINGMKQHTQSKPDIENETRCPKCGGYVQWFESRVGQCKNCLKVFESREELRQWCTLPRWSTQTIEFLSARLAKLRRNRQYREDKQRARSLMGLPPDGYGRLEVRRKLPPLAHAYLNYMHNKRSSRRRKDDAILFAGYSLMIAKFAQDHPLAKGRPMPTFMAFRELFYKQPPSQFVLSGYFSKRDELEVWLDDAQTKAPYRIAHLVNQALNSKDTKVVSQIRIFQQEPAWGRWEFKQMQ